MSMKAACVLLTTIVVVAIMAVCVMVKFATEMTVGERHRESNPDPGISDVAKSIAVIAMNENNSVAISERFPYVAAIARNSSASWSFACFASVVLVRWLVTSAHCRHRGAAHRAVLLQDFTHNISTSYPILYWRIHDQYDANSTSPAFDIAVAKLAFAMASSATVERQAVVGMEASVWKTVAGMDRRVFLINAFDRFAAAPAPGERCYESFGVQMDESLLCVDLAGHEDCFVHEFGPLYSAHRLVGVLAVGPRDCDVKLAVFTNVSYHAAWFFKMTHAFRPN